MTRDLDRTVIGARGILARTAHRALADRRGTAAIEFAIVAAVFLMILFGIVSLGFQFATRIALSYAVAEGGRAAVGGITDAERSTLATSAITYALNAYAPLVDPARATVSVTNIGTTGAGKVIRISIAYSDRRFSNLPFVPDFTDMPPISTTFIVRDPAG